MVPEAVPPEPTPEPAPWTAPAPAPASAPTPAPVALAPAAVPAPAPAPTPVAPAPVTPVRSDFTPTMLHSPALPLPLHQNTTSRVPSAGGDTSLAELSGFLEIMQQQADRTDAKMEALRKETDAKLERQRQESEAKLEAQRKEADDEKNLAALQSRLQSLHGAKLLTDDELYSLEDAIVDCIEVIPTAGASAPEVEKVAKMMLVSAKVPGDVTLARQLRRKFV